MLSKIGILPQVVRCLICCVVCVRSSIVEAVRQSDGDFISVTDSEIKEALKEMSKKGYYIEPTSAATIAGIKKYLQKPSFEKVIVSVFTGHGLKTTEKMLAILNEVSIAHLI